MTARRHDGWALKTPQGLLLSGTMEPSKADCWDEAIPVIDRIEGEQWWKHTQGRSAALAAARKLGYRVVKVRLVEVE